MKPVTIRRNQNVYQIGLIILAALASIVAGTSYLVFNISFSPLIVAGIGLIIIITVIWVHRPIWALYAAVLIVFLPIGLFSDNIQSNLNRSLTVVALIVWGVYVIIRRRRIVWTWAALFMLGYIVWCLVTLLWAQNLVVARDVLGGYALRLVLFLFLIANEIRTRETLDGLMRTLAVAGWIYVSAGIITLVIHGYDIGSRLQILEENENALGNLFPVMLIGVVWLAIRRPNPRRGLWIILSLLFIILSFVLVALSGSRGSAITWLFTILILFFWRQTRLWGIVGLFIMIAAFISAPFILSTTIDRFMVTAGDTLLGGREALWQAAWMLIRDHPLIGVGVGNSSYAIMPYVILYRSVGGADWAAIHNPILTIWADTGLPGLILYLSVLVSSIWSFIRQYLRCRKQDVQWLMPYFSLTIAAFLGYFASWIKGGGMELGHSYFLMLALLVIPSHLKPNVTSP